MTVIDGVVAPPGDHPYDANPDGAVSVTLPPEQNVVGPDAVTIGFGVGLTMTVVGADEPEHPFASVTLTL